MTTTETDLTTPQAMMQTFSERLNGGDLDGLVELYEPAAVFESQPGVTVRGRHAIREALGDLLALRPTITAEVEQVLIGDDVALVVNRWAMTGTAPDGSSVRSDGRSADVVRRQDDGRWLVLIDKP